MDFFILLAIWLLCSLLFSMAALGPLVAVIGLWPNSLHYLSHHPGCAATLVVASGFMASTMYIVAKLINRRTT